jgi:hypothetical protein
VGVLGSTANVGCTSPRGKALLTSSVRSRPGFRFGDDEDPGRRVLASGESRLSRKRVLNPEKKNPRDSPDRIAGWFAVMETTIKTSGEGVHVALSVALLAACAANLILVCSWL